MKVLIVSDTHGRDEKLEEAVEREFPFDMLIHCGDVEGREIFIEALAQCPCCIVAGNNDFFTDLPREQVLTIGGKRVLVTHGHYYGVSLDTRGVFDAAFDSGCQAVLFGHTHRPYVGKQQGILAVNPGSLAFPRQVGRKPSYAVMEVSDQGELQVEIKYLDSRF